MSDSKKIIFGIDLGTTYSCIAYVDEYGKPVIVPNFENQNTTPSIVFFDEGGNIIVGDVARENSLFYPNMVVSEVKREMGNPAWVFPFEGNYEGKTYRAEEVSALILKKLVKDAQQKTGIPVEDVVITCPAYFGVNQREATAQAGEFIGLNVREVINEPTAAAIAYGMNEKDDQTIMVFDLGGGTFDATLIDIKEHAIDVICTGGDHHLGGKDWDTDVVNHLAEVFMEQVDVDEDPLDDDITKASLYLAAETAKKTLTQRLKAPVTITHAGQRVNYELTREKFDELTTDRLERTITLTRDMLEKAKKKGYEHFNKILMVGGSTKMPQIRERLEKEFKDLDIEIKSFSPDEAVANGAAIYGWKLSLDEEIIHRISEKTGQNVEDIDIKEVSQEDLDEVQKDVAEDHGYQLESVKKAVETVITNVSSKSFGVVAIDGKTGQKVVSNLVNLNDKVPLEKERRFGTEIENQSAINVQIMENLSEELAVEDLDTCTEIESGHFELPDGLPQNSPIDVTFWLNKQGRLEVTAVEPSSGRTIDFVIETDAIMSKEEVEESKKVIGSLKIS